MKKRFVLIIIAVFLLSGCGQKNRAEVRIAATTKPVCFFAEKLCAGTGLAVVPLITESVSCLHDYSLNVDQVRTAESAELILCSGADLEHFMEDILEGKQTADSSEGIALLPSDEEPDEPDPHIWLSPKNAKIMVSNLSDALSQKYPEFFTIFRDNEAELLSELDRLQAYGEESLAQLNCRKLVTFHDGFAYFADAFDLTILEAIEEESGSEASARELIHLIRIVEENHLPAVFTEANGSPSAASIISSETGAGVFSLDMGMSERDYFSAMYHNIDTIKEALG